jgi:hypothetical protein
LSYTIENSESFINGLEPFSGSKLKEKELVREMLHYALSSDSFKLFEDVCFTAKYICGLKRVLKSASTMNDVNNTDSIKSDLSKNFEQIIEQVTGIIQLMPEEKQSILTQSYLEMTPEAFSRLNDLISDLEWAKMYLNQLKRNS